MTYLHKVVHAKGSSYDIGYTVGKECSEEIKHYIGFTSPAYNFTHDERVLGGRIKIIYPRAGNLKLIYPDFYEKWLKQLDELPQEIRDRMRGFAEGAGVPYEEIAVLHFNYGRNFPQGLDIGRKFPQGADTEDCSACIAFGKATNGITILGKNSDNLKWYAKFDTLIIEEPNDGYKSTYVTYPGTLSIRGSINEKGLVICSPAASTKPVKSNKLWTYWELLISRTCSTVDEALDILKDKRSEGGYGIHKFIADPKRAVHMESWPGEGGKCVIHEPELGYHYGASPTYVAPEMQQYLNVMDDETDPDFMPSVARKRGDLRASRYDELLKLFLHAYGKITPAMLPRILGDHGHPGDGWLGVGGQGKPGDDYTICSHGTFSGKGDLESVAHVSQIMIPSKKTMYVAWGSPCQAEFIQMTF
jgi:hypothetical protein